MLNKVITCFLVLTTVAYAQPVVSGIEMPPASFSYVEKGATVNLDPGAWCYNAAANAVLITSATRAKASCELESEFTVLKEKAKYTLKIELLKARVISLSDTHEKVLKTMQVENERLAAIALDKPANKSMWFVAGGFTAGVITTVAIYWLTATAAR